jgi:2-dehydro-3-deoxyphosphogluconate aldolase/(4S)-4-hydroxy-2-oxoglutarate aldolase
VSELQIAIADSNIRNRTQLIDGAPFAPQSAPVAELSRKQVAARIAEIAVVPALRLQSVADALFVAEALAAAGLPIVEVSAAGPGALEVISRLTRHSAGMIVGAGNILSADAARGCLDAGARFLTGDIFIPQVVELAARENVAVIPGALTPTEVMAAWRAGADFVKVTPCDAAGPAYIRSLKLALPEVHLIAAGGVNQLTAFAFMKAGATALTAGDELVHPEAACLRQRGRIQEMARRFLNAATAAREATADTRMAS